ncbi:hypothetical protein JCM3765_000961 [Sporobolomyces pararoseus]
MSDTTTRVKPTFSTLPETLKKRIVRFLKELDEEEQEGGDDDCGSCCGGGEGEGDHAHEHNKQLKQLEKAVEDLELGGGASNVSNLSLTNKEWHKACCSYIWQSPDLAERSLESLFYFQKDLLPKYSEYVDSLYLMQNGSTLLEEDEESPYKMVDGTSEEEREEKLIREVEAVAGVEKPKDESIRQLRARTLVLAEIVKASPQLVKIEFDCPEVDDEDEDEEEEEEEANSTELRDYVVDVLKQHANAFKSLSHIGYSLTPVSTSSYEDAASLLSTYSTQLRSVRLDCVSAPGDSDSILNALVSLEKLESLDLADSDFAFDYSQLQVQWPLRRLVLGEFLELSTEAFSTLVNKFSSTLEILNLDGSPSHEEEEGDAQKVTREFKQFPINLPKLEILEISTNHSTKVLDWLTSSSTALRELRIGFCPNFDVDQVVNFVEKNQDRINYFELDVSCFGIEEVSKLGAVCEELGIKFQLVSVGYEDDDFLGGGFGGEDDEEDAEWEDEE